MFDNNNDNDDFAFRGILIRIKIILNALRQLNGVSVDFTQLATPHRDHVHVRRHSTPARLTSVTLTAEKRDETEEEADIVDRTGVRQLPETVDSLYAGFCAAQHACRRVGSVEC